MNTEMIDQSLSKYLSKFKKLRIDRAHGFAPHKPILLLSILQSFKESEIQDERIFITPELVAKFKTNWSLLVTTNHDCKFALPFFHLQSEKFWHLIPKPGFEGIIKAGATMRNFSNLNAAIEYAVLDKDLILLMLNVQCNSLLTNFLLDEYFPNSKSELSNFYKVETELLTGLKNNILNEASSKYKLEIKDLLDQKNEEELYLRGSYFKKEIPKIYNNTCCISGMKIDAKFNLSMIDACHIVPFSKSFDDTVSNGIALCPNLHRAFDRGLISIDSEFRVLVSNTFIENESAFSMKKFGGKRITLPSESRYFPLQNNFEWHRENIFKG